MIRPVLAQMRLELVLALRRGESVLVTLVIPLLLLVFFGTVPVLEADPTAQVYSSLPRLLTLAIMSTGMLSVGIGTAFERQYGVLKRLGATPLTRWQLLLAKAGATVALAAMQSCLLLATGALVFGWHPSSNGWLALPVLLLGLGSFAGLGFLLAGTLPAETTLAVANGLYLALLLLGGVVVPVERLPAPLSVLGPVLPSAALADLLRATLSSAWTVSGLSLPVLIGWSIIMPLLAARCFRWE